MSNKEVKNKTGLSVKTILLVLLLTVLLFIVVQNIDKNLFKSQVLNTNVPKWRLKWNRILPSVNSRTAPLVADLNSDGKKEIAVTLTGQNSYDRGKGRFYILKNDGSILAGPIDPEPNKDNMISSVALTDVNNDGNIDILAGVPVRPDGQGGDWTTGAVLKIFAYDYRGNLLDHFPFIVSPTANDPWLDISLSDINADGSVDIVSQYFAGDFKSYVSAYDVQGNRLPGWPRKIADNRRASPLAIGKMTRGTGTVGIGTGSEIKGIFLLDASGNILPGWPVDIGPDFNGTPVTLGDLDNDGDLEIVTSSWREGEKLVAYHHTGELQFSVPAIYPDIYLRAEATLADIDGDGDLEVLAPTFVRDRGTGRIDAYHHDGQPVQGWPVDYPGWIEDGDAVNLAVADVDGDGKKEVLMTTYTSPGDGKVPPEDQNKGFINAWHNDGRVVSGFPIKMPRNIVGYETTGLILTDLDNNGFIDLVTVNTEEAISTNPKTYVSAFELTAKYNPNRIEWPKYHYDDQLSGMKPYK